MDDQTFAYIGHLRDVHTEFENGEARFWVNDSGSQGPTLSGVLDYGGSSSYQPGRIHQAFVPVKNFVGMVDEQVGGMIAYGEAANMEELAAKLNKLHIIESILKKEAKQ